MVDTLRASPAPAPSALTSVPAAWRMPTVAAALGFIALYFALQLLANVFASLLVGWREGLAHPGESATVIKAHVMEVLQQPDLNAALVVIALPLIALLVLAAVRYYWPCMWSMPQPPGFGMTSPPSLFWFGMALLVGLVMPIVGGLLTAMFAHGHGVSQNIEELGQQAPFALRIPLAAIVVTVGPLIEELLFRGVLLSALMRRLSMMQSVFLCAALFALVHLAGLHFQWYALPGLLVLALALCWLRLQSASLWPAVLAHGTYNAFTLIALLGTPLH